MAHFKPLARIIGPKGLMPNKKSRTLVNPTELIEVIKESKMGQIEYRVCPTADIKNKIVMRSFDDKDLKKNFDALVEALEASKPEFLKGKDKKLMI